MRPLGDETWMRPRAGVGCGGVSDLDAVWAFAVAGVVALAVTPFIARLAQRVGAVDAPKERSLHTAPTPRLGGLAIFAGVLVAGLLFMPEGEQTRGILLGVVAIVLVGALDDVYDLHPAIKLLGQVAAAVIPVAMDVRVENLTLPFVDPIELPDSGGVVTVVGIVAMMNVVNFSDGQDGLAAGVCAISAGTFAVIALSLDRTDAGILAALSAGAAVGFLVWNFPPARIFMGDSGSNLLGLLLACVAIQGVLKTAAVVALVFPLVILAVPILDTGFVLAKRIKYRQPVYRADAEHFHHRFDRIGFSPRRTVLYLYGWTLSLAALALALRFVPYSDNNGHLDLGWSLLVVAFALVALAASVYLVLVLEILKFRRFRERQLRKEALEHGETPDPDTIEHEIVREVETGDFEALGR